MRMWPTNDRLLGPNTTTKLYILKPMTNKQKQITIYFLRHTCLLKYLFIRNMLIKLNIKWLRRGTIFSKICVYMSSTFLKKPFSFLMINLSIKQLKFQQIYTEITKRKEAALFLSFFLFFFIHLRFVEAKPASSQAHPLHLIQSCKLN